MELTVEEVGALSRFLALEDDRRGIEASEVFSAGWERGSGGDGAVGCAERGVINLFETMRSVILYIFKKVNKKESIIDDKVEKYYNI